MNLKKAISAETILLDMKSATKDEVIVELVDALMKAGRVRDLECRQEAIKAVMERERKMSTGMQNGIAIPHGKTNAVDGLVAALGVKKAGVDFGSLDGKPSHIFVMTLSPDNRTGPHIQFLAEISRHLNDPRVRERILNAQDKQDVLDCLADQ